MHSGPVTGSAYWTDICLSPEILIFVFFMMSDPKTSPSSAVGQAAYGAGTAALAALLLAVQPTEFGVMVAILSSLTVTCALRLAVQAVGGRQTSHREGSGAQRDRPSRTGLQQKL